MLIYFHFIHFIEDRAFACAFANEEIIQTEISFDARRIQERMFTALNTTPIIIHYAHNLSSFSMFFNIFVYDRTAANLLSLHI